MPYRRRVLEQRMKRYLALFSAVAVTGPRQSGKSTLLRTALPDIPYVSFDDPEEVRAAGQDPRGYLSRFHGSVILDEAQRAPELFSCLKLAIDADRGRRGRFILSGSNQFSLSRRLSENLVVAEILKAAAHRGLDVEVNYFRESNGLEADLLLHHPEGGYLWVADIKSGHTPKAGWIDSLGRVAAVAVKSSSPAACRRVVIYQGETKRDWPSPGCDFLSFEDAIATWQAETKPTLGGGARKEARKR